MFKEVSVVWNFSSSCVLCLCSVSFCFLLTRFSSAAARRTAQRSLLQVIQQFGYKPNLYWMNCGEADWQDKLYILVIVLIWRLKSFWYLVLYKYIELLLNDGAEKLLQVWIVGSNWSQKIHLRANDREEVSKQTIKIKQQTVCREIRLKMVTNV